MEIAEDAIEAVEEWLRVNFPRHDVRFKAIWDREVVLFRARLREPAAPRYELEISYEAFEDHDAATIVEDLDSQNAAQLLRDKPTVRLMYNRFRRLVETDRHSSRQQL